MASYAVTAGGGRPHREADDLMTLPSGTPCQLFVDGKWSGGSSGSFAVLNPSTGEIKLTQDKGYDISVRNNDATTNNAIAVTGGAATDGGTAVAQTLSGDNE